MWVSYKEAYFPGDIDTKVQLPLSVHIAFLESVALSTVSGRSSTTSYNERMTYLIGRGGFKWMVVRKEQRTLMMTLNKSLFTGN